MPTVQVFPGEGPSQFDQTFPVGTAQVDAQHGTFLDRFLTMGGAGPILVSTRVAATAVAAASSGESHRVAGMLTSPVLQLDMLAMRAASRPSVCPLMPVHSPACPPAGQLEVPAWGAGGRVPCGLGASPGAAFHQHCHGDSDLLRESQHLRVTCHCHPAAPAKQQPAALHHMDALAGPLWQARQLWWHLPLRLLCVGE